jgi:hypothetical protein
MSFRLIFDFKVFSFDNPSALNCILIDRKLIAENAFHDRDLNLYLNYRDADKSLA